jgi:superfamily II DNA/RNA helicase
VKNNPESDPTSRLKHWKRDYTMSFDHLGLRAKLLKAIKTKGYTAPPSFRPGLFPLFSDPNVVNYDAPAIPEDYIHRIGRTGRTGGVRK